MCQLKSRIFSISNPSDRPDVLFFSETKFGSTSLPSLDGYSIFRKDRDEAGTGGGVCIFVANHTAATHVDNIDALTSRDIEQVWCVVQRGNERILLGCIYRPPTANSKQSLQSTKSAINVLKHAKRALKTLDCSAMYVYGDFNMPHVRYESADVSGGTATLGYIAPDTSGSKTSDEMFLEGLEDLDLQQLVTFPTFRDSYKKQATNTLDLVITDDPSRAFAVDQDAPLGRTPKGRAHVMVQWSIAMASSASQPPARSRYLWSRADWKGVIGEFQAQDWASRIASFENVELSYNDLASFITAACDKCIPKTTAPIKPLDALLSIDNELRDKIERKRATFGRYVAAGKNSKKAVLEEYKHACKVVKSAVKAAREKFELNMVKQTRQDGKQLHSYVQKQQALSGCTHALRDSSGILRKNSADICRILNDSFHAVFTVEPAGDLPTFAERTSTRFDPVASNLYTELSVWLHLKALKPNKASGPDGIHPRVLKECADALALPLSIIFCRSHTEGQVPSLFKQANVSPIFKKGCKVSASNYRPVSLTSVPCKIMESIQHQAILNHLTKEGLLAPEQHGFLPKKSCTTNLLEAYEVMCEAFEKGHPLDVIYTDFRKAFDTVPHRRLLLKLQAYGIDGHLLTWIRNWLTSRTQRVVLGNTISDWTNVLSGIPQGSVLGPLLFLIYINDLPKELVNLMLLYADDGKLLGKARTQEERDQLQADIDTCVRWARTWLMSYSVEKCKVMHIGRLSKKSAHVYTMKDSEGVDRALETTCVERDLGVLVSDDLKLGAQCRAAAAKARWKLGAFKKTFTSRSQRLWEMLWKAHIRPHLEHAIQAWSPYLKGDIKVLENVQRAVTKHMGGMKGMNYEKRLTELGWTTLEARRTRGDLIMTYQLRNSNAAVNLNTWHWTNPLAEIDGPVGSVRAGDVRLNPPVKYKCKQRENFLTTRVAAPLRDLPKGIINSTSVNTFKNRYDEIWQV